MSPTASRLQSDRDRSAQTRGVNRLVCSVALLVAPAILDFASPAKAQPGPVVATNHVVVTNMVIVTNYVITTNIVLVTNGVAAGKARATSDLPPVSWVPPGDSYDWIQLKSGEWLKGRLLGMQERQLDFDSEKLKDLTFDWKDIRQVRSPRTVDVWFADGGKASGPVTVTPDQITVDGEEPQARPRSELQSLTPGGSKERSRSI